MGQKPRRRNLRENRSPAPHEVKAVRNLHRGTDTTAIEDTYLRCDSQPFLVQEFTMLRVLPQVPELFHKGCLLFSECSEWCVRLYSKEGGECHFGWQCCGSERIPMEERA